MLIVVLSLIIIALVLIYVLVFRRLNKELFSLMIIAASLFVVDIIIILFCTICYAKFNLSYTGNVEIYNALQARIESYDKTKDTVLLHDI